MAEQEFQLASVADRNHFLIRRLHSLSGIIPIGVFLCFHMLANLTILFSGEHFQESVQRIHLLEPYLIPIELIFIFIPIVFHALIGLQIFLSGRPNTQQYRYGGNVRYLLQRVTGVIALVFIVYHVVQLHWLGRPFGGAAFVLEDAATSTAGAIQSALWIAPFYAIGIISAVFHFANGVWTALIVWGITIGPRSQMLSGRVCIIIGLVLGAFGLASLSKFRTMDLTDAGPPAALLHRTAAAGGGAHPHS